MSAPDWLIPLLGWREATRKQAPDCRRYFNRPYAPNIADATSMTSARIAAVAYRVLRVTGNTEIDFDKSTGAQLEDRISQDLTTTLAKLHPRLVVKRGGYPMDYRQFAHLSELQNLFDRYPALRSTVGQDYQIKADVCVGLPADDGTLPLLHAAVSSKWTLRSDRAQNVRHEFATLVRNRRGRLPHLVLVTAEPLPTRLLSIARGTGEIDAVYHLLFDEIALGVREVTTSSGGPTGQLDAWSELVGQRRLLPYSELATTLATS